MEKDYKVYTIRRLFKEHIPLIEKYYSSYDSLHYNPLDRDYIEKTMVSGSFWGICDGRNTVAVTYMQPAECQPFARLNAAWEMQDLMECDLSDYLLCGYIRSDGSCRYADLYAALVRLWMIQAVHSGKKNIVHYTPAHMDAAFRPLFDGGFCLAGLRGLDNIVPHYIFTAPAQLKTEGKQNYRDTKSCHMSDTMTISMLCEHGYRAFDTDRQQNLLFGR